MTMLKLVFAALLSLVLTTGLVAPAEAASVATCEKQALSKDGKPLYGAAKNSFMKKCTGKSSGWSNKAAGATKTKATTGTAKRSAKADVKQTAARTEKKTAKKDAKRTAKAEKKAKKQAARASKQ